MVAAAGSWSPVHAHLDPAGITHTASGQQSRACRQRLSHPHAVFFLTDLNGIDLTPVQDTPVALRKEDTYVHFNVDIEIQKHVEKLTKGM